MTPVETAALRVSTAEPTAAAGPIGRTTVVRTDRASSRPLEVAHDDLRFRFRASQHLATERLDRVVNAGLALFALVILSPLLLLIAIAVKLSSPGPILYRQPRIGIDRRLSRGESAYDRRGQDLGGSVFLIYKFRTMRANAERQTGPVWATRRDQTRHAPSADFCARHDSTSFPSSSTCWAAT